jgi:hypothetical protein
MSGREIQPTFEKLWHDCLQEESCIATRSEPTKEKNSTLASRFKGKKKVTFQKGSQKKSSTKGLFKGKSIDTSKIKCFVAISWVLLLEIVGIGRNIQGKGNIVPQLLRMMNPKENRKVLLIREKIEKNITWLSSIVITGPKTWLVDSVASKHMTGYKEILSDFKTKSFAERVELGDDKCYKIEGVGSISFRLESGAMFHVDEVLYVPRLGKNLLSVATLKDKGYWVIFKDMKSLLWAKGSHLSTAEPIGTRKGLYIVTGQSVQALAHDVTNSSEL